MLVVIGLLTVCNATFYKLLQNVALQTVNKSITSHKTWKYVKVNKSYFAYIALNPKRSESDVFLPVLEFSTLSRLCHAVTF